MTTYIWPEGGGAGGRFAPKYLVGNVPAGDSNVASSVDGFVYIPDSGDGSGIALALTQPDGPGDVYLRPGTYDLGAGAVVGPLTIPSGTRVMGAGQYATFVQGRYTGDAGVFVMLAETMLRDIAVSGRGGDSGSTAAITTTTGEATIDSVFVEVPVVPGATLIEGIRVQTPGRRVKIANSRVDAYLGIYVADGMLDVGIANCSIIADKNGNGIVTAGTNNSFPNVRIENCCITVLGDPAPVAPGFGYGLLLNSPYTVVDGCTIEHTTNRSTGIAAICVNTGVALNAGLCGSTISNNIIRSGGQYGIQLLDGARVAITGNNVWTGDTAGDPPVTINSIRVHSPSSYATITGNTIAQSNASPASVILCESARCVVTGNAIVTQNFAVATGIELSAVSTNNVVVSNTTNATTPVNDLGVGNEVAHNI